MEFVSDIFMRQILLVLSSIVLFSCQKDDKENDTLSLDGSYAGTFHRTGMDSATVQIDFENNRFEGFSERPHYPAICAGTFSMEGSSIVFSDTCSWTADFDWTLILNGKFALDVSGDVLKLTKTNNALIDEYTLRRIVR